MAGLAGGNVWTWPDPVRGDQGFQSPALNVWQNTYDESAEPKWYDNWNQYQQYQGNETTWRNYDLGGQYKNALYSFTKQSFDPYNKVEGYTPQSGLTYARIIGDIQGYLDREFPELSDFSGSSGQFGQGANSTANLGGEWDPIDRWNKEILSAQSKVQAETGVFVPGNVIKAIMRIESGGDPNSGPAYGLLQITDSVMGNYETMRARSDPAYGIWAGVNELALRYQGALAQNPSYGWANAAVGYFSGHYTPNGAADVLGTSDALYMETFSKYLSQLDAAVRGGQATGGATGSWNANSVLGIAQQYVGVPYVWGGIPGKGQNPWDTGWDCSGFVYWLDQNYGGGAIPMGSHYQYQYAQNTGQLFLNTAGLQQGDLVFFDTGNTAGGGAELNRAGHVGVFMGMGADGKMKMIHAANEGQDTLISNFDDYKSMFIGGMHAAWSGGSSGYGSQRSAFDAITGGVPFPVGQEFGPTTYADGEGAWKYGYGPDYGVTGHPGLDVSAPLNTGLYSPVSGKVVIAGGTPWFQDDRYGATPQTGELMIELANGDQVVLGHMGQIDVKVGDMVTAGQAVGFSGISNGAHVHVEYRRIGANTPSGYQIIDPRLALGGFSGQFGTQAQQQYKAPADNWAAFMRATAQGLPVTGYSSGPQGATFHNWLKSGMLNQWKTGTPSAGGNTIAGAWGVTPYNQYNDIIGKAINPTGTGA